MDHIEQQVEYGAKFPFGKPDLSKKVKYAVFVNEVFLGDNSVLAQVNNERMFYLNHNIINSAVTTDEKFVEYSWQTMSTLLKNPPSSVKQEKRIVNFFLIRCGKNTRHEKVGLNLRLDLGADNYITKPFYLPELNSGIPIQLMLTFL